MVGTDNPTLVTTYESQIVKLEEEKVALNARKADSGQPKNTFEAVSRTALTFLSSPWKLWAPGSSEHQRAVLKLAFTKPLRYCRNEGYRTADLSLPFRVLEDFKTGEIRMVGGTGLEPVTPAM